MELKQHPLSAAFPAMSDDDFSALVDDVRKNGQREPIMLFEGMVLDGWHRYRACMEVGAKPQHFNYGGDDPVAFVLSHNLHRRHMTASQRAAAVVACTAWAPAHRPKKVETISTLSTNDKMAKAAGTTVRTITDAKTAHKAGLTDAVKVGAMTAHEAAQVARGKPAKKDAKRTLDAKPADVSEASDADAIAEAHNTLIELAEENEQLRDRLAVEAMNASEDEKTQAAETIRELRATVKTLEAELDAVKKSRDTFMRENGAMKAQLASQRRDIAKLTKATA